MHTPFRILLTRGEHRPEAAAALAQPGSEWVLPPDDRVDWLAELLRHAHDLVRSWGRALID